MRLKRRIFGVFAAALAGVLLCGCTAAEDMQEHRTEIPITIKVGSDNYPPFNYTDENGNPIECCCDECDYFLECFPAFIK